MYKRLSVVMLVSASVLAFGFLGFKGNKDVVAVVGGQKITYQELETRIKTYPAQIQESLQTKENKARVLDQMIDEMVLLEAAEKNGYAKKKEYTEQMDLAKKQIMLSLLIRDNVDNKVAVTEEEMKAYYQNNPKQFQKLEQRRVRHILTKTEQEAKQILEALKKGGDFAKLATEKSQDPGTAANGGDLGWFSAGQLVPEFERAAFDLKSKGQLSGVVKTQFGYHILKLEDSRVRPESPYEQVKGAIQQNLLGEKKRVAMETLLGDMKKKLKVTKNVGNIK